MAVTSFPRGKKKKPEVSENVSEAPLDDIAKREKRKAVGKEDLFGLSNAPISKKKAKKKSKSKEQDEENDAEPLKLKTIDPLTYSQLDEGMVVLGRVASIGEYELKVSLPGHLVGSVHITAISPDYTRALKSLTEQPDKADQLNVKTLKEMFQIGQVCMCSVESIERNEETNFYKIGLSLKPQTVHNNMPPTAVRKGFVLQGAVKSIEDHGFIMDVGISGIRAFLPHNRAEKYIDNLLNGNAPSVGQILPVMVTKVDEKTIRLTADPIKLLKSTIDPSQCTIHNLFPGMTFIAKVKTELKGGIKLEVGDFTAYAHRDHLAGEVEEESEVPVHLLYVLPTVNKIFVSCKDHLQFGRKDKETFETYKVGDLVNDAEVIDSSKKGLVLHLGKGTDFIGWVSHTNVAENVALRANIREKYPVGTKVTCRLIQYDYADGMFICTMHKSLIAQQVFSLEQLNVGDKVSCKVKRFVEKGAIVQISKNLEGFVSMMHLSDVPLTNPEKKYPVGAKLNCRIMKKDGKRIQLTNKSILVKEDYPIISSYNKESVGVTTEGVVAKVSGDGILMHLFNDVKGWVPKGKLSTEKIDYPEKLFYIGQVLKCKVIGVDEEKKQMTLSLIIGGKHKPLGSKEKRAGGKLVLGNLYDAIVKDKNSDGLIVEVSSEDDGGEVIKAFIPKNHLTDHVNLSETLLETYSINDEIKQALCFEKDVLPILTLKPMIINAAKTKSLPSSFDDIQVGITLPCVVSVIKSYGVFVKLPTWKFQRSALVPLRFLADFFVEKPEDFLSLHETVIGKVIERNEDEKRVTVSLMKKNVLETETGSDTAVELLASFLNDLEFIRLNNPSCQPLQIFKAGLIVTGTVTKVTEQGIEVAVESSDSNNYVKGIVTNSNLEGLAVRPQVETQIVAVVTYVDYEWKCLELSCNPDLIKRVTLCKGLKKLPDIGSIVRASVTSVKTDHYLASLCIKSNKGSGLFVHVPTRSHLADHIGFAESLKLGELHNIVLKEVSQENIIGIFERQERKKKAGQKRKSFEKQVKSPFKRMRQESEASSQGKIEDNEEKSTSKAPEQQMTIDDPGWDENFDPFQRKSDETSIGDGGDGKDDHPKKLKTHISKKEKKELARLEAEEVAQAEQRVLDGEEAPPETEDEFERLVLASPNSSLCWIQYMAFHMGKKDFEKAREVSKRALERIHFREETERLNIYMALLNMECSLGDANESNVEDVLAKALKYNDQYKVYDQAASIFALSGKLEKAEKLYKTLAKKYNKEPEVWTKLGTFYFQNKNLKEARFTLQRGIQNLEKKHHVGLTAKFGQLEFKMGEMERGKTIFETILGNFPARNDLWSIYIDMLVKVGEIEAARTVCERMITLQLQPEKMKKLFKKFLDFEQKYGDQQKVDQVRKKALDYVENIGSKK